MPLLSFIKLVYITSIQGNKIVSHERGHSLTGKPLLQLLGAGEKKENLHWSPQLIQPGMHGEA